MTGLLFWYLCSVIFSFCFSMMGNCYLKNSGAVPEKFNLLLPTIFTSIVPIFNVIFAIKTLSIGLLTWKNPEARDEYRTMFSNMQKQVGDRTKRIISKMENSTKDVKKKDEEVDTDEK